MPLQRQPERAEGGLSNVSLRLNPEQRRKLEWLVAQLNYGNMTALLIALIEQEYKEQGGK